MLERAYLARLSLNTKKKTIFGGLVEHVLNWTAHFASLAWKLDHAPNADPLGKNVRFILRSPKKYWVAQRPSVSARKHTKHERECNNEPIFFYFHLH